jgi:hypothetical protein
MRMGLYLPLILSFGLLQAQAPLPSPAASSVPDSTRLEPIKTAKPHYPDEARDKGLQGRVESTETVSGDPILAKAASDAFKKLQ